MSNAHRYGKSSERKLEGCDPRIVVVARRGLFLSPYDLTIVWGPRDDEQQMQAFLSGNSKKKTGSKHQFVKPDGTPFSQAIDFAPWCQLPDGSFGIPWKDTHAFAVLGGIMLAAAEDVGEPCIYGGDWDMDGTTTDQLLMDWGHLQLATEPVF